MPMVKVSPHTMQLIGTQRFAGFQFARVATRLDDGWWNIPVVDDVAMKIALERVRGESDDRVVSQLIGDRNGPTPL